MPGRWKPYLLSLVGLVGLPVVQLGLDLLDNSRNLVSVNRRIDSHESTILDNGRRAVIRGCLGGCSVVLLALLALLSGGHVLVVVCLLAQNLDPLDARVINLALSLSLETAARD